MRLLVYFFVVVRVGVGYLSVRLRVRACVRANMQIIYLLRSD